MRLQTRVKTLCVVSACMFMAATTAHAERFGYDVYWCHACEQAHGIVECHDGPVFLVADAGGYTGPERGEIISSRLNDMFQRRQVSPDDIHVTRQRGEWVIVASRPGRDEPDLLATADLRMAQEAKIEGLEQESQPVRAKRLAMWWAALLKDHIRLAQGEKPTSTSGCMMHMTLGMIGMAAPDGDEDALRAAVAGLAPEHAECLSHCASVVPEGFQKPGEDHAHQQLMMKSMPPPD